MRGSTTPQNDPLRQIVFSFDDDQLFKVVMDYDAQRTEGMTGADLIEAVSAPYGSSSKPAVRNVRPLHVPARTGVRDGHGSLGRRGVPKRALSMVLCVKLPID